MLFVASTLPLFLIFFVILREFQHAMKMMSKKENLLKDEFFTDAALTPKEGVEQNRRQECLKVAINEEESKVTKEITINKAKPSIKYMLKTSRVN